MNAVTATPGSDPRRLRRTRWARWSLAGVAVAGLGFAAWRTLPDDQLPDFSVHEATEDKKAAFFAFLLPHARAVNAAILDDRARLRRIRDELAHGESAGFFDARWLRELAEDYDLEPPESPGVGFADKLLLRVDAIPVSLILAQAANESAWGTSRFARHGNNLFGMRTYGESGLVPHRRAAGKTFKVAAYASVRDSIDAYVRNLNTNPRYRYLRQLRADLRRQHEAVSGMTLSRGLGAYSKLGEDYISTLQSMIESNHLEQYDG